MTAPDKHAWRVERHAQVDSTNRIAADRIHERWANDQHAEGIVIAADRQQAGRGQYQRRWESPEGGIYLSAVIERSPVGMRGRLALIAGVAMADALIQSVGIPVGLRWPNDLMIADKKIGGILCESLAQGERWAGVIGIGINVNTRMEDLPPELRERASSLRAHDGESRSIPTLQEALLASLGKVLQRASAEAEGGAEYVIARARTLDLLYGRAVEFQEGERIYRGIARGIGDSGELLIAVDNEIHAFTSGTVLSMEGRALRG